MGAMTICWGAESKAKSRGHLRGTHRRRKENIAPPHHRRESREPLLLSVKIRIEMRISGAMYSRASGCGHDVSSGCGLLGAVVWYAGGKWIASLYGSMVLASAVGELIADLYGIDECCRSKWYHGQAGAE